MGLLETFNEEYIYRGDIGYKVGRKSYRVEMGRNEG